MRWETKQRVYMLSMIKRWTWWPEVSGDGHDLWSLTWLRFCFEWFSKEWLDFCESHGGGMLSTLEWVAREIEKDQLPLVK